MTTDEDTKPDTDNRSADEATAAAAVLLAKTDPHRAIAMVEPLLAARPDLDQPGVDQPGVDLPGVDLPGVDQPGVDKPGVDGDNTVAKARWARGRALYELARNDEAMADLAVARKETSDPELISRIDISLSAAMSAAGDRAGAAELLASIMTSDDPVVAALARSQNALLLLGRGALVEAADDLRRSIDPLEQSEGDGDAAARAVGNLAYCEMTLGLLDQAEANYRRAVELGTRFDEGLVVAGCRQNLGYLAMRRGHLAEAIDQLSNAEEAYRAVKGPARNLSTLYDDLAETHRIAGLAGSSVRYATAALHAVRDGGNEEKLAEAKYRLAACALDAGDHDTARTASREAAVAFENANRPVWVHRAWAISLDTIDQDRPPDPETIEAARGAAKELEEAGWVTDARRVRNRVALGLLENGDYETAAEFLTESADDPDQSIVSKLETLFGRALAARSRGHRAAREVLAAHALIVEHSQRLADPELRAGASRLSDRFRRLDLGEIDPGEEPVELLAAEERWRALSFDLPRVIPSTDRELAAKSEQLRHAATELGGAERWDPALAAEVERLEQEIQPLSLRARAAGPADVAAAGELQVDELRSALDGRTFVEWVEVDRQLVGVMVTPDTVTSWSCGLADPLRRIGGETMTAMGRLLRPGLDQRGQQRRWDAMIDDCLALADTLFGPGVDTTIPIVLSPPSWLANLPWSLVLGAPDQSMNIAPSATAWVRRRTDPLAPTVGIAVGPDLEFGERDGERIREAFATAEVLAGKKATTEAVRRLIGRCNIVHIAAHGRFRTDSPRFSTLRLGDGPLALYELDREAGVAPLMVLAACDAGRTASRAGGELLGFGPTLLTAGATNVIAPTVPVADRAISDYLGQFYRNLPSRRPADALAVARAAYGDGPIHDRALASAVLCFGGDCGYVSKVTSDRSGRM